LFIKLVNKLDGREILQNKSHDCYGKIPRLHVIEIRYSIIFPVLATVIYFLLCVLLHIFIIISLFI